MTNAVFNNINKLIDIDTKIKANDIINSINTKIIDIVYLIDTTGSMRDEVKTASNLVIQNMVNLEKLHPDIDFKFGLIYYNDPVDVSTDFNDYLQLTKDINKIRNFCDKWKTQDGGDTAEDWAGGYKIALYYIYWRNGKKIIVHICDAPAHGEKYSKKEGDNHKDKIYENELDNLMKNCAEKNIEIVGMYRNIAAKECFLECKKIYNFNGGISFVLQEYDSIKGFDVGI